MFILILKTILNYFFSIGSLGILNRLSIGSLLSWQLTLLCKAATPLDISRFLVTGSRASGCSSAVEDVTWEVLSVSTLLNASAFLQVLSSCCPSACF